MALADLHNSAAPEPEQSVFAAVIARDVTAAREPAWVIIPEFSEAHMDGPASWQPVVEPDGIFYPKKGDACSVVRVPQGKTEITTWTPSTDTPDEVISGGGGGAPSGPAGGVLSGTYPNPGFAADMATQAELDAKSTADRARANHTGTQTLSTISDAGTLAALNTIASANITDGTIVNADVNASAAIAYGKLALTGAILNADLAGSIAYSKLSLTGSIVNADVSASAAIAYAKLALTGSIVNADISASAAIALSKLATDPLARANHTGTQLASTVSNFDTQVRTNRLDQMAAPTASVSVNSQRVINGIGPQAASDLTTRQYVDTRLVALNLRPDVKGSIISFPAGATVNSGAGTITGNTNATIAAAPLYSYRGDSALVVTSRLLVNLTGGAAENGIYTVTQVGDATHPFILTRASDADSSAELEKSAVQVVDIFGSTPTAFALFVLETGAPITVGTTPLVFTEIDNPPYGTAGGSLTGDYPNPTLATNSVGNSQVADNAITSAEIGDCGFGTWHAVPIFGQNNTGTATANTFYYAQIIIPHQCTLTGVSYFAGATASTVRSALYDSSGARVANRTSNLTPTANASNKVPFDSTYAAEPGRYFVGLIWAGAGNYTAATSRGPASSTAGPGAGATPVGPITVPTDLTTGIPVMSTY